MSSNILIEALDEEPDDNEDGVLLFVRQRIGAEKSFGPPLEMRLTVSKKKGMGNYFVEKSLFVAQLKEKVGLTDKQSIYVIRMIQQSRRWKPLIDPYNTSDNVKDNNSTEANAKGMRALKNMQTTQKQDIYLADGDIIVWKVIEEDPDNNDDLMYVLNHGATSSASYHASMFANQGGHIKSQQTREISLQIDVDDFWG